MLFCSTDGPLRDQHYERLMKSYYKSLCSHIEALGSDPKKLFPYEALETQLKSFGQFGLGK